MNEYFLNKIDEINNCKSYLVLMLLPVGVYMIFHKL